jgi:hypothetical protein
LPGQRQTDRTPSPLFTVITFLIDAISGFALDLETGVPCYQVEDEERRIHLLISLPIDEEDEDRWCLWLTDQAGFDPRSHLFSGSTQATPEHTIRMLC